MTIVCGESHTSTHSAFGALAFGVGTSEVEHVLATQTIMQRPAKTIRVTVEGVPPPGVEPKDRRELLLSGEDDIDVPLPYRALIDAPNEVRRPEGLYTCTGFKEERGEAKIG